MIVMYDIYYIPLVAGRQNGASNGTESENGASNVPEPDNGASNVIESENVIESTASNIDAEYLISLRNVLRESIAEVFEETINQRSSSSSTAEPQRSSSSSTVEPQRSSSSSTVEPQSSSYINPAESQASKKLVSYILTTKAPAPLFSDSQDIWPDISTTMIC